MKRLTLSRQATQNGPNSSKWNEIRTALYVGRLGTVAAAAKALNVHRATVIRHIVILEAFLGEKLFQRHQKGYALTEFGADLVQLASETENDFKALAGRAAGCTLEVSGVLHITSRDIANPLVLPLLHGFQTAYPKVRVRYTPTWEQYRLDHGEAHISLVTQDLKSVTHTMGEDTRVYKKHFMDIEFGLYASRTYAENFALPETMADAPKHRFAVFSIDEPFHRVHTWLQERVPASSIVFECGSPLALDEAIQRGIGIGFLPKHVAQTNPDLLPILKPWPDVNVPLWFAAHRDMYMNAKITAFFAFLEKYKSSLQKDKTPMDTSDVRKAREPE